MRNKSQLNPVQLITADLWIDFFAQHFNVPPQNVAFAKSVIRIDDFWALFNAVNSGLEVPEMCIRDRHGLIGCLTQHLRTHGAVQGNGLTILSRK